MTREWMRVAVVVTIGIAACASAQPTDRVPTAIRGELAPSGKLRAAINVGNVVLARRDGTQGVSGVSVDIADVVAKRLGVPVELIIYDTAAQVVERQRQDAWDIAFIGIDPKRAADITFTAPYVIIEGTYLVRDRSAYAHATDMDRPGVKIAVGRGTAYDLYLTRAIKNATLVRFDTSMAAIERFAAGETDAAAGIREALFVGQKGIPGTRVLPDSFNRIEQAVAIPKPRTASARYVAAIVERLKIDGFVRAALDRHGQAGAQVAPPARR